MNVVVSVTEKNRAESQTILWFAVYQINHIYKSDLIINFKLSPMKESNFSLHSGKSS